MRTFHRLRASTWAASSIDTIPLGALPAGKLGNMVPYITKVELMCDIAITVGAGGQSVTAQQWANLLSSLTFNVPGGPWGPVNLNGEQLRIAYFLQSGDLIPYASDTNGDLVAANSAGAITRRVRHVYSFEGQGHPTDPYAFCPPAAAFREGSIELAFSALPTNTSAATITFYPVVHLIWRAEANSVSRIRTIAKALIGPNETIPDSGLLLRLLLHNKTADAVAADFTGFRLWKDGVQVLEINRPLDVRAPDYAFAVKGLSATPQIQETFSDMIGGNFVRGINVYPTHGARALLGELPVGDNWRYDYDGAPTVANWEVIYTMAYRQNDDHARAMVAAAGSQPQSLIDSVAGGKRIPSTHVLVPRGPGGSVLNSTRLKGFTPMTAVRRGSGLHQVYQAVGQSK